jgi:tetraacyldisaccharide 4'-kinase
VSIEHIVSWDQNKKKLSSLLWFFSQIYRFGIFWRHCFFEIGLFSIKKSPLFTISVGNIAVGGTGKTSFVYLLASALGDGVAILNRGYRALEKHRGVVENSKQGDEAYLLASNLPKAHVIVGKNRRNGAALAKKLGARYIILDDGMQHRKLYRDIEVVMMHLKDLSEKKAYLPMGRLRDTPRRLEKADYIVVHGVDTEEAFQEAKMKLAPFSNAPIIGTSYVVEDEKRFRGRSIGAFCALARPLEFYGMLHKLGCRIVKSDTLPDHRPLSNPDRFIKESFERGAEFIVCTEKDFVKLPKRKEIVPLKVKMEINFGKEYFDHLLERIQSKAI